MKRYLYLFVVMTQAVVFFLPSNVYATSIDMQCSIRKFYLSDDVLKLIKNNPNDREVKFIKDETTTKKWWQFWGDDQKLTISIDVDSKKLSSGLTTTQTLGDISSLSVELYPDLIFINRDNYLVKYRTSHYTINRINGDFTWEENASNGSLEPFVKDGQNIWTALGKCYPLKRMF